MKRNANGLYEIDYILTKQKNIVQNLNLDELNLKGMNSLITKELLK